jgi:hypothetical protein
MKQRKYIVFTLVIVMLAVIALSVNTALAAGSGKAAPTPTSIHPPVCTQFSSMEYYQLSCNDRGKDISDVKVITEQNYELSWDHQTVTLRVYWGNQSEGGTWTVSDKAGNVVSGKLP